MLIFVCKTYSRGGGREIGGMRNIDPVHFQYFNLILYNIESKFKVVNIVNVYTSGWAMQ